MNASNQSNNHQFDTHGNLKRHGKDQIGGFLMRIANPFLRSIAHKFLDKMDAGLEVGTIEGHLPDGSIRMLGGRANGPYVKASLNSYFGLVRIGRFGSIGLFESWRRGEWASDNPEIIFELFTYNRKAMGDTARASGLGRIIAKVLHLFNRNSKNGSRKNIEYHYDLGNDFYTLWLDDMMNYSSADFSKIEPVSENLALAQHQKIDRMLHRLDLKADQSLLEIGCGWGGFAKRAIDGAQVDYHGITLSNEQKSWCDGILSNHSNAKVSITDYRDVNGQYDAIASIEMVEAVGEEYWPDYLDTISNALKSGGKAAIQYISIEDDIFDAYKNSADFIQHYIFPGGMLVSESRFRALAEKRGLKWQDQYDFGLDYAATLKIWRERFDAIVSAGELPSQFDEKFIQMWRFYLLYCEGGFRGGAINVSQVTLTKT